MYLQTRESSVKTGKFCVKLQLEKVLYGFGNNTVTDTVIKEGAGGGGGGVGERENTYSIFNMSVGTKRLFSSTRAS